MINVSFVLLQTSDHICKLMHSECGFYYLTEKDSCVYDSHQHKVL